MERHTYIPVQEAFEMVDGFSQRGEPFFIAVDFEMKRAICCHLFDFPDTISFRSGFFRGNDFEFEIDLDHFHSVSPNFKLYEKGFEYIQEQIHAGNSYLLNYSAISAIDTDLDLVDIYASSNAEYKLLIQGEFVVFSPECFVKIKDGTISTFPMKGTIDAAIPDAEKRILEDVKEKAEHATIVDLLRNDLSQVAENVHVEKYRYIQKLETSGKDLLQVSSHISGTISEEYQGKIGSILSKLLPAGSVSGAPKMKTVEIIRTAEGIDRGFYCGIAGVSNGKAFDSCVLIRFIEENDGELTYRSGGGITFQSNLNDEYNEVMSKVYVPIT